jgi:hypothetical protein
MIVSALVVTLASDPIAGAGAMAELARDPRLTLGVPTCGRVPVVAETESTAAGAQLCDALGAQPGVVRVDVVAIDFSLDSADVQ